MTKTELLQHRDAYEKLARQVDVALEEGQFSAALRAAVASLTHVDGMMRFTERYEAASFSSVKTIDTILRYAPSLLDPDSLTQLGLILKADRRIDRSASDDLAARLKEARSRLKLAYRVWRQLESCAEVRERELLTGVSTHATRALIDDWCSMSLLDRHGMRSDPHLRLLGRQSDIVRAKCPGCGRIVAKARLECLAMSRCPDCDSDQLFVIHADAESTLGS